MDKEQVFNALKEFIEQQRPFGLKVEVREDGLGDGWTTSLDDPAMKAMIRALEKAWGVAPIKMGCGGSIPFVKQFSDALNGAPALLIGVEDPQSRAHSANESLGLAGWEKSVISCIYLFEELSNKA
jgi:acetylornithine deacetylase/succinyl-diaminopimelate desuccinylase-like protein